MISFGELESGQDYYKVYGKRMKENDIMSDLITENNEVENSSEKIVSMEESEDFAKGEVAIKKKVKNNKDYETLARTVQYSVYSYGGKHYYLGAISLYCPKKTHGNELYAARAKIIHMKAMHNIIFVRQLKCQVLLHIFIMMQI